jgi:hypothetical protein
MEPLICHPQPGVLFDDTPDVCRDAETLGGPPSIFFIAAHAVIYSQKTAYCFRLRRRLEPPLKPSVGSERLHRIAELTAIEM